MYESEKFEVIYEGSVSQFEERILYNAEQELRKGRPGPWCKLADVYARQLTIIKINPYPEDSDVISDDGTPPSIKHINMNTGYENFYRWGVHEKGTGNHRIIYAIHNYHKVIMLHYFDKQYNGLIKRCDIIPAEMYYQNYCTIDPSYY